MSFSNAPELDPRRDRPGWNGLESYIAAHLRHLRNWEHFIVSGDLFPVPNDASSLLIEGRIECLGNLYIDVKKTLEVNDYGQVRTIAYKYHAGIHNDPPRTVFRYDNAHVYRREGHADAHHKHRFDDTTWEEITPPEWIGYDNWPTLGEVIEELHNWWLETGQFLQPKDAVECHTHEGAK